MQSRSELSLSPLLPLINQFFPNSKNLKFKKNKKVIFAWEQQENITEYELLLSDDLEFTQIFLTLKTKTNSINLEHAKLKKGQFFWKVTGLGPYNTNTSSKRRSFRLMAPSPVLASDLKPSKTT